MASRELQPTTRREVSAAEADIASLAEAVRAFEQHPGVHTAGDLLSRVTVLNTRHPTAALAARLVNDYEAVGGVRALAEDYLNPHEATDLLDPLGPEPFSWATTVDRANRLKRLLRVEPRNAVRWTDLGLAHLNLGAPDAARKNLRVALALAPGNRHVLRSAVRLFTLLDDPEAAREILTRNSAVLQDPWLRAADLAMAAVLGEGSASMRRNRQFLESGNFAPWHLSELAGQVATSEMRAGNLKQAKKLMRRALIDPTENAVAQAEWAAKHGIDPPSLTALELPRTYEARAIAAAQRGDLAAAVTQGLMWQSDQPFDPSAAIFVSYTASVGLEEYDLGAQAARQGLIASPHHGLLRNNFVFSLASSGNTVEALENLRLIVSPAPGTREAATLTATRGLVAFRSGQLAEGRELYSTALQALKALRERDVAALAAMMWAREELYAVTLESPEVVARALEAGRGSRSPEVALWRDRLLGQVSRGVLGSRHP